MKPSLTLVSLALLLLGGVSLPAADDSGAAASTLQFARARRKNALIPHHRLAVPRGGSPELALHYVRRGQATSFGLGAAKSIARLVPGGRDFDLEILDWSYDGAHDRFSISFRMFWKLENFPGRTSGIQGVYDVDADGAAPVFTRTRSFDSRVPLPPGAPCDPQARAAL